MAKTQRHRDFELLISRVEQWPSATTDGTEYLRPTCGRMEILDNRLRPT